MSEKFKRGSIVTNKNGDEFDCKVVILVTGDRSTSDHHFSGVCIQSYNKEIHPVGDFSTTWYLEKFVKLYDSFEEWQNESPAEQPVPTFWDVANAFKWAAEYNNETGESLSLYEGQWTILGSDGDEVETEDLTPGNVAELYCLQKGFEKDEQPVREVEQEQLKANISRLLHEINQGIEYAKIRVKGLLLADEKQLSFIFEKYDKALAEWSGEKEGLNG